MNQSDTKTNPLKEIEEYLENTKYFDYLCQYLNLLLVGKDRAKIDKEVDVKVKELEEISNKPKYFEKVKNSKMRYVKEVKKLDIILNSKELLQKEFNQKNEKLEEEKKIPTISAYKRMLEKRRKLCMDKISELSKIINPINYMNHKQELEDFIENSKIDGTNKEEIIINIQKEFIKSLKEEISECEDIDLLKLYISKDKQIKDIFELNESINEILKMVILKLCNQNGLRRISKDNEFNANIINSILDTKIIELNEVKFELEIKEGTIYIKTYEKETYEKEFELATKYSKRDLEVKTGKKLRLFI